jgi:3-methyladenine DNA glycosylase AlkC
MPDESSALKHGLGRNAINGIGKNVARVMPAFRRRAFTQGALRGLRDLELKPRVFHIAHALRAQLPDDDLVALDILVEAASSWEKPRADKYAFAAWPVIELVGELGRAHPARGLEALRQVTKLFSAEFAIRGFIEDSPKKTLKVLAKWTRDPDPHVRRLVSEGTRPRLPWGTRVQALLDDPKPGIALIEKLKDDPSEYVRRSVANHLNDVAKDRPKLVTDTCKKWAKGANTDRLRLIHHALRTLVKQGDRAALRILGFDPAARIEVVNLQLSTTKLKMGDSLELSFDLHSRAKKAQPVVIDYALHHVKKAGNRTRKTFKLKTTTVPPGGTLSIHKRHHIKPISTRTYHSGVHALEVLVNGQSHGTVEFDLRC